MATLTSKDFEEAISNHRLDVLQPKVNKYRTVRFTTKALTDIKEIFNKYGKVVFDCAPVLYPAPASGRRNPDKFIHIINKCLKEFKVKYKSNITTHSYRTGYITKLLKHTTTHNAQQLVGHADIRSTTRYNRHLLDQNEQMEILEDAFD